MTQDALPFEDSNRSNNPSLQEQSDPTRRQLLRGGVEALASWMGWLSSGAPSGSWAATGSSAKGTLGFKGVPASRADAVVVPEGYEARVLAPWGEPVGIAGAMPAFKADASNSTEEQAVQMGMHHDGMQFYPLGNKGDSGLLVMNHEYTDDGLLHPGGMTPWTAEKVRKAQAAHGISVIEIVLRGGHWEMVRPSRYARRITASTAFAVQGPAAGHPLMRTAADPEGHRVLGTLNNCASGMTPWGTYLSGEENWRFYFDGGEQRTPDQQRWGLPKRGFYGWAAFDERFDATKHPNEFHRFGWVVEVNPMDPGSTPIKRTALGRAAHEGAWVAVTRDGRAVVYSGEDAAFEYIYKFVSRDAIRPAGKGLTKAQANRELLDHGTLFVARFDADGRGQWLPLVHGQGPLTAANGFADQGEVLIKARQASDLLGATRMDRPEWLAIDPTRREVFCCLTNNSARGKPGQPGVDGANPRAENVMGQIIRWREGTGDGSNNADDFDATQLRWTHLLLAGDPANARAEAKGNIKGDIFGCPDGLMFDPRGRLWICTDVHASQMNQGEFERIGNNQLLACDLATGEVRRFLTGPVNCELTGATLTPDGRTLFVNIQHPGESPSDRADPNQPTRYSVWPDGPGAQRPRSATVVVRRRDGGVIGG